MALSAEVRWFSESIALATAVEQWFKPETGFVGGGGIERTDVYLEEGPELGVKSRQGRAGLEIKVLAQPKLFEVPFAGDAAQAQLWSKVVSQSLQLPSQGRTVVTTKSRWVRKFAPHGDGFREIALGAGPFREEPLQEPAPPLGCNLELTAIRVARAGGDRMWWTFGAEAFATARGADHVERTSTTLRRALVWIEAQLVGLPTLRPWQQLSYPAWLQLHERGRNA